MQTTFCFDFGNSRLKLAIFTGRELNDVVVLESDHPSAIEKLLEKYQPQKSILSSVINHDAALEELLSAKTKFHKLSYTSKIPITTAVGKPETIGADRLAICSAAVDLYPQQHCLAIGLGTCITYNYINKFHEFLGGSISPGMNMRFRAMHEQTAMLPMIEAEHSFPLIGYDTKTNLLSGVIIGMAKEIDGIIDAYNEKYSHLKVMLTGGDMDFFMPHIKNKLNADPYLLFKGLFAISELNNV
ncbi:type III pantothenate kinase [mine drainage metagenome]|uniref:Type III pantothenate kinase n=1 Tax=mine drainage metagenome TaxID=410659 RepID=A0A1J5S934_9ZZZZ